MDYTFSLPESASGSVDGCGLPGERKLRLSGALIVIY